jgi:3',5'-cyclic AMP phosphodiesterase CpdA
MNFCHFTDPHIRPAGRLAYGMVDSNAMARRAFAKAATLGGKIDAIIVTGDLTDNGLADEYAELRAILSDVTIPVFLIPGNHDRRENLIEQIPGVKQSDGFVQYIIDDFPARIIMLDSVVPFATYGELCPARLAWLRATLAEQPERETILALHHPPFCTGIPQFDATALRQIDEFRAIVAANPQVRRVLCGHIHRFIFGNIAQATCIVGPAIAYPFQLTLDPAIKEGFVLEPSAFLLHTWTEPAGFTTHEIFVDTYPGPFQVPNEPDYPGRPPAQPAGLGGGS